MKALVWPVATYDCENWTLGKNEETRLDAFEMKGLRGYVVATFSKYKVWGEVSEGSAHILGNRISSSAYNTL